MASIKDAIEETTQEEGYLVKLAIFAAPIFGCIYAMMQEEKMMWLFYTCLVPSIVVIIGTMIRVANNTMNFRETTLPTWNIFTLIFDTIRTTFALIPAIAINGTIAYLIITKLCPMIAIEPVQKGAIYLTYAVVGSIILTVFMLYAKRFKISDTFDLDAISNSCIDVLIKVFFLIIILAVVNGIVVGVPWYLCYLAIGTNNFLMWYVYAIVGVFNAAIIGNYLGQLNHEALHQNEDKKAEKKLREEMKQAKKEAGNMVNPMDWNNQ